MPYKLIAGVLGIVCLFVGFGLGMYQWGASNAREDQAMKDRDTAIMYADEINKREEQHAKDQTTINTLSRQLNGMQNAPITACEAYRSGENGVLFKQLDNAFGHLQEGVKLLVSRCDQLNIDARRDNVFNTP
jgi:hypothetical protein